MDRFLGFSDGCDELGLLNGFRDLCENYIKGLVKAGMWFSCCQKAYPYQVNIMSTSIANEEKLGARVFEEFRESSYRSGIYKYLLANFMCYVEMPTKSGKEDSTNTNSSSKFLATGCPEVIEYWANLSEDEVARKYGAKSYAMNQDDGYDVVPYMKLGRDKCGNKKVINCKEGLDLSAAGLRVIPVFMLKAGVDTLYEKLQKGIVRVDLIKDSGDKGRLYSTLSLKELNKVYDDKDSIRNLISDCYNGNFMSSKYLSLGVIKLPEVGRGNNLTSRYVDCTRIINLDYDSESILSLVNKEEKRGDGYIGKSKKNSNYFLPAFGGKGTVEGNSMKASSKKGTRAELESVLGEKSASRAMEAYNMYMSLMKVGDYSFYDLVGLKEVLPGAYGSIDNTSIKGLLKSEDNFIEYSIVDPILGKCRVLPGVFVGSRKGAPEGVRQVTVKDLSTLIPVSGVYGYMAALSHFLRDGVKAKMVGGSVINVMTGCHVGIQDVYNCVYPIMGSPGIPILELEGLF